MAPHGSGLPREHARAARLGRALLIVLLALAVVGLSILAIGARQPRVPAPFGPARNGEIVSSADGDIYLVDPLAHSSSPLIAGPTFDFGPVFSRDGTRFSFLRGGPTDCGKPDCGLILVVANADGTGVRELTRGVPMLDALDWSPDGSQLAILTAAEDGQGHGLAIVNADGSGMRTLDLARPVHLPSWLPPDGGEIVFRGEQLSDDAPPPGIFAVRPDGSGLREISTRPAVDANDYEDISVSPDGTRIGYRGDDGPGGLFRSHVLDLRTGADRVLPSPDGAGQFGPVFSPDGQSVLYLRGLAGNRVQLVVAPADGSSTGKAIGPEAPLGADGPTHQRLRLLARRRGSDRQLRRREAGSPPPDRRVAGIRPAPWRAGLPGLPAPRTLRLRATRPRGRNGVGRAHPRRTRHVRRGAFLRVRCCGAAIRERIRWHASP